MKKTCLIISGGDFSSCPKESYDLVIAVDKGLEYALRLNISPDVIIGDFDSLEHTGIPGSPNLLSILEQDNSAYKGRAGDMMDIELEIKETYNLKTSSGKEIPVIKLPKRKDDTDTMAAIRYAIAQQCSRITMSCIMGGRFDHLFANLQAAAFAASHQIPVTLLGDRDEIHVFSESSIQIPKREGWSLSVLALSDACSGVQISGAGYSADNLTLNNTYPLGLSNEWKDDAVTISVKSGILAVILSKLPK